MAYRAITVFGGPFQNLLLALPFFLLLTLANGSASSHYGMLEQVPKLRTGYLRRHNPSVNIRLPTYPLKNGSLQGLGYSNFARHYFRNRCLLSLPRPTKMFQFGRLPLLTLYIQVRVTRHDSCRVSPFGNLRFKADGQLPEAYRSLLRPLSVICVKAFVVCAYVTFYAT